MSDSDPEAFRAEVKTFLSANWISPKSRGHQPDERSFRAEAVEAGFLYRGVPTELGGSGQVPDQIKAQIIKEEFRNARAPAEVKGVGTQMLVPTLLECGEQWQKEFFIPKTLTGEYRWCQGYSEPGAGSDLASVRTRGELIDGQWVINGQKVWTSYARDATFMFALVRTETAAPKHRSLSYLLIDMRQPGVDIRPLRQINGGAEFNEVFLTEVKTPADWIVGERGKGWTVSKSLLKHERDMLGGIERSQALFDSLLGLAGRARLNGRPALQEDFVRDRLAHLNAQLDAQRWSAQIQMARAMNGRAGGERLQMMNKLCQSNFAADIARLAIDILDDDALISPIGANKPGNERWINQYMNSLAAAIAGGTSNIQRNVIAQRGLGLPRESSAEE